MELRVLGPLEVCHDGGRLDLGSRKQRITLAVLAVNAGRYVSVDQLIGELWGERPIPSAVENTRTYAARLRRLFDTTNGDSVRIERVGAGYRLSVDPAAFDLAGFDHDAAGGRVALRSGDLDTAHELLERARLRWRGQMLDGLPRGPLLDLRCAAVERDLVNLVDELAEVHLSLGNPASAVALTQEQVRTDPVRERSHELLMRALYQLDGPAAALSVYEKARHLLVDQLGVEPGPGLRDVQRRILHRDPTLAQPRPTITAAPPSPVPRQLPPAPTHFVARDAEIGQVRGLLLATGPHRHRPAVTVIYGPGGAGKSALALQVGNQLSEHFPDGQLYVDLLGSTPGIPSPSPAEVLERLLHSLGVRGDRVPMSVAAAAALLRSTTAGKRLLMIVDNATTAEQVAPLVPSTGTCAVLVTSRRPLTALDADHRIRLGPLAREGARTMLAALVDGRNLEPPVREAILDRCGGLPLAIRIIAARLATRPDLSAERLAQRLADHPLDELQHDGLAVRESIRAGYNALTTDAGPVSQLAAQAFRALGTLPLPHFTPGLVAALLSAPDPAVVQSALDHLVDAQLLEPAPGNRYRLHDLVRETAIEVAEGLPAADRDRSLQQALTYYAHTAERAGSWTYAGTAWAFTPSFAPPVAVTTFGSLRDARSWIAAEVDNLLLTLEQASATVTATACNSPWLALSERLWTFLYLQHRWSAAQRLGRLVLRTAERPCNEEVEGWAHLLAGRNEALSNRLESATRHIDHALAGMRRSGNDRGEALALVALGNVAGLGRDSESAFRRYQDAMRVVQTADSEELRSVILINLSIGHFMRGQFDRAATAAEECIAISRRRGYSRRLGRALTNVSATRIAAGMHTDAVRSASEAFYQCEETGDRIAANNAILMRSHAHLLLGHYVESLADIHTVLARASRDGDQYVKAIALWHQSEILLATGHGDDAKRIGEQAAAIRATQVPRDPIVEHLLRRYQRRSQEESPARSNHLCQ